MIKKSDLVIRLDRVDRDDEKEVGNEAALFGEIAKLDIPIPKGFIITANAYLQFILKNNVIERAKQHLLLAKANNLLNRQISGRGRLGLFFHDDMPEDFIRQIFKAYKSLDDPLNDATVVMGCSFNKKKFTSVKGEAILIQKIRTLWSIYFNGQDIDYPEFEPAIFVYKIPKSFQSGVMFTVDPIYSDKNIIVINERNRSGNQYELSRHDLKIIKKTIKRGDTQKLTDKQIIDLARYGKKLQEHYYFPQEVQFFANKDGVYITKTKPLTTLDSGLSDFPKIHSSDLDDDLKQYLIRKRRSNSRRMVLKGYTIYPGIASGYLRIIRRPHDIHKLKFGDVAVITNTKNLSFNDVGRLARAIVIESRSNRPPYYSFSRLGKPMIVTMPNASKGLREGLVATVNAVNGIVYI